MIKLLEQDFAQKCLKRKVAQSRTRAFQNLHNIILHKSCFTCPLSATVVWTFLKSNHLLEHFAATLKLPKTLKFLKRAFSNPGALAALVVDNLRPLPTG